MNSAGAFFQEMLVLYAIAVLGFFVRKKGILKENAIEVLTQLLLCITLPALILYSLDTSFSFTMVKDFFWLVSMSFYVLALSIFLAIWMRRRSKLPEKQKSVYEGITIFGNQGFIGYAVSYILLGKQGIIYSTMFNLCYLVLIWTYGIYLFSKNKDTINWKNIFLNPGILSTFVGLLVFFLPFRWPTFVSSGLALVGNMTVPLSMMMIGILIGNVELNEIFTNIKNNDLWKSTIAKLLVIPFFLLPFSAFVPFPILVVAVLVSGMPSAPTIVLYAQRYGGDTYFASLGVLLTTALCIITIPFLYLVVSLVK
jgi:malate permease and related proteins